MVSSLSWPLVDPARATFGREAEGLALATEFVRPPTPVDEMGPAPAS